VPDVLHVCGWLLLAHCRSPGLQTTQAPLMHHPSHAAPLSSHTPPTHVWRWAATHWTAPTAHSPEVLPPDPDDPPDDAPPVPPPVAPPVPLGAAPPDEAPAVPPEGEPPDGDPPEADEPDEPPRPPDPDEPPVPRSPPAGEASTESLSLSVQSLSSAGQPPSARGSVSTTGSHKSVRIRHPHCPGVVAPHVPVVQVPQSRVVPHPSLRNPQLRPCSAHVVGVQQALWWQTGPGTSQAT
jgi:hypothetical protein